MHAIILAGGFGTRLQSVVQDRPKPMALVGDRPFLEILMDYLIDQGIDGFVLSVGYLHEVVLQHFGDTYRNYPVKYVIEDTPLGTGGAIQLAMKHIQGETALVTNGDSIFKANGRVTR